MLLKVNNKHIDKCKDECNQKKDKKCIFDLKPCCPDKKSAFHYADFYATMPSDNTEDIAPGADVNFSNNGPSSSTTIVRTGPNSFKLCAKGTYQILFQVSVSQPGQLVLTLNGMELAYTVDGRSTGNSQIVGMSLVTTKAKDSILTVRNPLGNASALTITPFAGGSKPVSAHLVITQIA